MKWIKRIIIAVLLCVFLGSLAMIGLTMYQYRQSAKTYEDAANRFVQISGNQSEDPEGEDYTLAPLTVDFDALRAVNSDVEGWLYCEGTVINYPVLHGTDNDLYLHHLYDKTYSAGGSIFVEMANRPHFQDANTVIYGHHMRNGSMFGGLENWKTQSYYDAHPVFWLLTPEQDYRIDLLGGYTTSAYSDTYVVFQNPGTELETYLQNMLSKSVFKSDVEVDPTAKYVLLSTCAYVFDDARFVLHGKLVPVDSAGGVLKEQS